MPPKRSAEDAALVQAILAEEQAAKAAKKTGKERERGDGREGVAAADRHAPRPPAFSPSPTTIVSLSQAAAASPPRPPAPPPHPLPPSSGSLTWNWHA